MKTTKTPFKQYTTMNNSLINKLGCSDVYRTFVLSLTADKETNKTDTTIEQLAGFCGEKSTNYLQVGKSESFNNKLRETKEVIIKSSRGASFKNSNGVTRNEYTFLKGSEFRMIDKSLVDVNLNIKLKGYMIKLWSIASTNTFKIGYSANEIYKLTGVSKVTQKKYNDVLVEAGFLTITENGMILNVEAFKEIKKTVKPTEKTLEIINLHKTILKSHIEAYNKGGNKITSLTRDAIETLKMNGMPTKTCVIATYLIDGFKDVKDINKLINSIEFPKSKKEVKTEDWSTFTL